MSKLQIEDEEKGSIIRVLQHSLDEIATIRSVFVSVFVVPAASITEHPQNLEAGRAELISAAERLSREKQDIELTLKRANEEHRILATKHERLLHSQRSINSQPPAYLDTFTNRPERSSQSAKRSEATMSSSHVSSSTATFEYSIPLIPEVTK